MAYKRASILIIVCVGSAAPGSDCDETRGHTLLFRVDIPEPTAPGIETVVTSATLKLFARRRRRNHTRRRVNSPTEDIVIVTVYQLTSDNQWRPHVHNQTEVGGNDLVSQVWYGVLRHDVGLMKRYWIVLLVNATDTTE